MANIKSIGGNPIVPASVEDGSITTAKLADGAVTDAKLAQTGGVLGSIEQITSKMQVITGHNWCSGVSDGYMDLNGNAYDNSSYVHTDMVPVSEGDTVKTYSMLGGTFTSRPQRFVTAFDESGNAISVSGAENSNSYTVPAGVASVVISVNAATNYMVTKNYIATAYEPYYDAYYVATSDFLGDLLAEKVDKDGTAQVKTPNIEGFADTGAVVYSENIFSEEWFYSLGYVQIDSGRLVIYPNDNYRTYIMPTSGATYDFTNVRFALKLAADKSTAVGEVIQNVTTIDSDGASWIAFSFYATAYTASAYVVTERLHVYAMPTNWELPGVSKQSYSQASGSIAAGGSMRVTEYSCIKDGYQVVFKGFTASFTAIRLNFVGYAGAATNYINVSATELTIKNNNNTPTTFTHGLTIANDVSLLVEFINGKVKVTLESSGLSYTQTVAWYQTAAEVCYPQIVSDGTAFSDAKLTASYSAATRSVWYFGDSYISFGDNARWPYYLVEAGYSDNALFNGAAGGTSYAANIAMRDILEHGTPSVAVLATGMNDGSDGDTPRPLWTNQRDAFIRLCARYGITPVLCTVPTVPTVNNEQKNAWVRSSGYRYIDFAKAVGASSSGEWYAGMLSSDNVHPTAKGAKALYSQVLSDLPEIFASK